jgi:hypothetical protein
VISVLPFPVDPSAMFNESEVKVRVPLIKNESLSRVASSGAHRGQSKNIKTDVESDGVSTVKLERRIRRSGNG